MRHQLPRAPWQVVWGLRVSKCPAEMHGQEQVAAARGAVGGLQEGQAVPAPQGAAAPARSPPGLETRAPTRRASHSSGRPQGENDRGVDLICSFTGA